MGEKKKLDPKQWARKYLRTSPFKTKVFVPSNGLESKRKILRCWICNDRTSNMFSGYNLDNRLYCSCCTSYRSCSEEEKTKLRKEKWKAEPIKVLINRFFENIKYEFNRYKKYYIGLLKKKMRAL